MSRTRLVVAVMDPTLALVASESRGTITCEFIDAVPAGAVAGAGMTSTVIDVCFTVGACKAWVAGAGERVAVGAAVPVARA